MQSVNTQWACGNYSVSLDTQVQGEVLQKLANLGLRFLGQRNSSVDKILGGFEKGADGKEKRKVGWKRGDVPFGKDFAGKLADSFKKLEVEEGVELDCVVGITEYVPSGGETRYKEENEIVGRHESQGDLDEWAKAKVGYEGPTHTEDGESFNPGLLAAVREYKKAALKQI